MPGVLSSEVNMGNDTVIVVFDDAKISIEAIRDSFNKQNFTVRKEPEFLQ